MGPQVPCDDDDTGSDGDGTATVGWFMHRSCRCACTDALVVPAPRRGWASTGLATGSGVNETTRLGSAAQGVVYAKS